MIYSFILPWPIDDKTLWPWQTTTIPFLPKDIVQLIVSHVKDPFCILDWSRVCKKWCEWLRSKVVWTPIIRRLSKLRIVTELDSWDTFVYYFPRVQRQCVLSGEGRLANALFCSLNDYHRETILRSLVAPLSVANVTVIASEDRWRYEITFDDVQIPRVHVWQPKRTIQVHVIWGESKFSSNKGIQMWRILRVYYGLLDNTFEYAFLHNFSSHKAAMRRIEESKKVT
jgi:hypothetical protein